MAEGLTLSLLITLVGMGLVFAAIVLFWLLMSALVRLAAGRSGQAEVQSEAVARDDAADERELKRRAAGVAVAVALARQARTEAQPFPMPPTVLVTAWQAVNRSRLHGQRGPVR